MVFQLAVVIVIPIILAIVFVPPFETPVPEEEIEEPEEIPSEPETGIRILYIMLGIIWIFFLFRILRQVVKGTYRVRTKF